ncbi:MAG: hypothetical protein GF408_00660 [Candidatus Omnitrophica bacterium]|nr:hypothetical protein [Candidatus Omnitrophota bacterium]
MKIFTVLALTLMLSLLPGAFARAERPEGYAVEILSYEGDNEFRAIKDLQETADIGMFEAKRILDSIPSFVKYGLTLEEANDMKTFLEIKGFSCVVKKASSAGVLTENGMMKESSDGLYAVVYEGTDLTRIETINLLRIQTGNSLKKAKDIVDRPGRSSIRYSIPLEEARKLKSWCDRNGIRSRIVANPGRPG